VTTDKGGERDHQIFIAAASNASNASLVCSGQSVVTVLFAHKSPRLHKRTHLTLRLLHDVTTTAVPTESYSRRQKYLDITITISSSVGPTNRPKVIYQPSSAASGQRQGGN
jgi:hypothetical protein